MGYIQDQIKKIGKEKGVVTSLDVARFYQVSKMEMEMNKLIALGYFEEGEDCVTFVKWKYKGRKEQ